MPHSECWALLNLFKLIDLCILLAANFRDHDSYYVDHASRYMEPERYRQLSSPSSSRRWDPFSNGRSAGSRSHGSLEMYHARSYNAIDSSSSHELVDANGVAAGSPPRRPSYWATIHGATEQPFYDHRVSEESPPLQSATTTTSTPKVSPAPDDDSSKDRINSDV